MSPFCGLPSRRRRDYRETSIMGSVFHRRRGIGLLVAGAGLAWAVATAGLIGGCAGGQQQRLGKSYLDAGDYDRAVEAARKAVDRDPHNPAALDLLSDAQTAAADFHFEQADKLMQAHRPGEALVSLDKTLGFMPAHPGANSTKVVAEKAVARCRELSEQARSAMGREDWEEAVVRAQEAHAADQGDGVARALFEHTRTALVSRHLASAQVALDKGDSKTAVEACRAAKNWDPDNPFVDQMLQKALSGSAVAAATPSIPSGPDTPRGTETQPAAVSEPPSLASAEPARDDPPASLDAVVVPPTSDNARPVAADPEPVVRDGGLFRPRRTESERVPPRLLQAEDAGDEDSSSEPPTQEAGERAAVEAPPARTARGERLIEVHPTSREAGRGTPSAATRPSSALTLITVDRAQSPRGRSDSGEQAVAGTHPAAASRPAPAVQTEREPRPGTIVDARSRSSRVTVRPNSAATDPAQTAANPAPRASGKSEPRQVFRGALSREDKRYQKQVTVMDGILVRLRDTDGDPVDADFEITAGSFRVKPDDVPAGGKIAIRGASGRKYIMTITWIDDDQETVHFSIDRVEE